MKSITNDCNLSNFNLSEVHVTNLRCMLKTVVGLTVIQRVKSNRVLIRSFNSK